MSAGRPSAKISLDRVHRVLSESNPPPPLTDLVSGLCPSKFVSEQGLPFLFVLPSVEKRRFQLLCIVAASEAITVSRARRRKASVLWWWWLRCAGLVMVVAQFKPGISKGGYVVFGERIVRHAGHRGTFDASAHVQVSQDTFVHFFAPWCVPT